MDQHHLCVAKEGGCYPFSGTNMQPEKKCGLHLGWYIQILGYTKSAYLTIRIYIELATAAINKKILKKHSGASGQTLQCDCVNLIIPQLYHSKDFI